MTEPSKKPTKPPASGKAGATLSAGKTVLGQTVTDGPKTGRRGYSDEMKATARAIWESDPKITQEEAAKEAGVPPRAIRRWSQDEGWSKRKADMSERAHAAADNYRSKLSELGPEITMEQQKHAEAEATEETAVQLRAQLLERHRKEWNVPRGLVREAVSARNFEKAKLAKITSETLKIVQDAERKAWGVDSGPDSGKVTVVIERD